jgi:polyisoprenoid-binding protein YceI
VNKRVLIALVALVVVIGGAFTARALFFGDVPEEVDLSNTAGEPSGDGDITFAGTWTVDNSSGDLDGDAPTSTFAGYRIQEEFAGIGASTAVGRTRDVEGSMTIDGNTINDVNITVDLTTLQSDKQMRDNALRDRGLQTNTYPDATFELSEPIEVSSEPTEGEEIAVDATGDFTLHGVTKQVTIPLEAKWTGDRITVVSSFDVDLDDYDIERPTTARVVSIADKGTIEMQLHFTKS